MRQGGTVSEPETEHPWPTGEALDEYMCLCDAAGDGDQDAVNMLRECYGIDWEKPIADRRVE